jgi:hypothetical protein
MPEGKQIIWMICEPTGENTPVVIEFFDHKVTSSLDLNEVSDLLPVADIIVLDPVMLPNRSNRLFYEELRGNNSRLQELTEDSILDGLLIIKALSVQFPNLLIVIFTVANPDEEDFRIIQDAMELSDNIKEVVYRFSLCHTSTIVDAIENALNS